jgi:hypothetical protein
MNAYVIASPVNARPSTTARRKEILRMALKKEDAGCSVNADRPYNWVERQFLKLWGTLTARELI